MTRLRAMLPGLAALAILAGCAATPSGKPLVITQSVDDHLRAYMREIAAGRAGAFAVSENGVASFYAYCEHGGCNGQYNFSNEAIRGCQKFGQGRCVVLSSNGVIKRPYTVAP